MFGELIADTEYGEYALKNRAKERPYGHIYKFKQNQLKKPIMAVQWWAGGYYVYYHAIMRNEPVIYKCWMAGTPTNNVCSAEEAEKVLQSLNKGYTIWYADKSCFNIREAQFSKSWEPPESQLQISKKEN